MHKKLQTLFSSALLAIPVAVQATSTATQCPEQIHPLQTLSPSPAGWTVLPDPSPSSLVNAGFYDGHPEQQAELAPSGRKTRTKRFINQWKFIKPHSGQIWIKCQYSDTNVSLIKQLDTHISSCTAAYDSRMVPPQLTHISCK